jgi:hypothetical protein
MLRGDVAVMFVQDNGSEGAAQGCLCAKHCKGILAVVGMYVPLLMLLLLLCGFTQSTLQLVQILFKCTTVTSLVYAAYCCCCCYCRYTPVHRILDLSNNELQVCWCGMRCDMCNLASALPCILCVWQSLCTAQTYRRLHLIAVLYMLGVWRFAPIGMRTPNLSCTCPLLCICRACSPPGSSPTCRCWQPAASAP